MMHGFKSAKSIQRFPVDSSGRRAHLSKTNSPGITPSVRSDLNPDSADIAIASCLYRWHEDIETGDSH